MIKLPKYEINYSCQVDGDNAQELRHRIEDGPGIRHSATEDGSGTRHSATEDGSGTRHISQVEIEGSTPKVNLYTKLSTTSIDFFFRASNFFLDALLLLYKSQRYKGCGAYD